MKLLKNYKQMTGERGPRYNDMPIDRFLVVLCVYKNGRTWHYNAGMFRRKMSAFEKCMWSTIDNVHGALRKKLMDKMEEKFSIIFRNFPYANSPPTVDLKQQSDPLNLILRNLRSTFVRNISLTLTKRRLWY